MKAAPALLLLVGIVWAAPVVAQSPAPPPERVFQDELDLQANASFVQGSGARAFGMGGAFLARADDATAASWNPAGLSYLKAPELSLVYVETDFESRARASGFDRFARGNTGTAVDRVFDFVKQTQDDRSGGFPDFMAFTWPWETGEASGAVQFSFQRVIPFTSQRTIVDRFTGTVTSATGETSARESVTTRTVTSSGGFDVLALGTGIRLSRRARLGVTLNRWFHGYEQTVLKPDQAVPSRQQSEFDVSGWNAHLGAIISPWDSLNLGFVLKTGFTATTRLSRVRYDSFGPADGSKTNFNLYARDDLRLELPTALGVGLSWRPRSNLTLSVDYTGTNWSEGRIRNFFALARANPANPLEYPAPSPPVSGDFCGDYGPDDPPPGPNVTPCPPVLPYPTLDTRAEQADTEQLRVGVEYVVIKSRVKWPVRAGYFRDGQFFRAQGGSAPTFDGFTLGTGLILGSVLFDVAYVYESGRYTSAIGEEETICLSTPSPEEECSNVLVVHQQDPASNRIESHKLYASVIYRLPRRR